MFYLWNKLSRKSLTWLGIAISLGTSACGPSLNKPTLTLDASQSSTSSIIGGREVSPGELPALTNVIVYDTGSKYRCTGALLSSNIVLTAAHCLGQDPRKLVVVFTTDLSKARNEMARPVIGAISHSMFSLRKDQPKDTGDIALIKYAGNTPPNYRSSSFLPSTMALKRNAEVWLAGYGISNGVKKSGSGVLRLVSTTIADERFSSTEILLEQRQGKGGCHGDSGGPAYLMAGGQAYLWGIMSRGYQDSKDHCDAFSVYTNLRVYYKWIQDTAAALIAKNQFIFSTHADPRNFVSGVYY